MDRDQTQHELRSAYEGWRENLVRAEFNLTHFCPPWLLQVTDRYCCAETRILVIGQEDYGWYWDKESFPAWPFKPEQTLEDFVSANDSVEALCWGYEQFNFAKGIKNYSAPYWQAFREIQAWGRVGVLATNLVRASCHAESIIVQDAQTRDSFIAMQRPLLLEEIRILKPDVCIFLTGPNYDFIIDATFIGIHRETLGSQPIRELALLRHEALPQRTFRTYHPAYLSRGKKWEYLNKIRDAAAI